MRLQTAEVIWVRLTTIKAVMPRRGCPAKIGEKAVRTLFSNIAVVMLDLDRNRQNSP